MTREFVIGPPVAMVPSNNEVGRLTDGPWPSTGEKESALLSRLEAIAEAEGSTILAQVIWRLTRLSLEPGRAESLWERARAMQATYSTALEQHVDFRVTLLSELLGDSGLSENMALVDSVWLEKTEAASIRDPESGLSHLNYFFDCLPRDIIRAERALEMLTVLAIEVDDPEGRLASLPIDEIREMVLRLAHSLEDSVRGSDQAFGGQGGRFAVVLPGTPKDEALRVAERLRLRVPDLLADLQPDSSPWTVSIGVAAFPGDARQADLLWQRSLKALSSARGAGGNRSWLNDDDRRSARRHATGIACDIQPLGRELHSAKLINLSRLGLCAVCAHEPQKDSLCEVRFRLPEGRELVMTCRVVWHRSTDDGTHLVGLRIVDLSAPDRHRLISHVDELRNQDGDNET